MPAIAAAVRGGLAALMLLLAGVPASAAGQPDRAAEPSGLRWSVQPAGPDGPDGRDWFEYTLAPGTDLVDWISVTNLGEHAAQFAVYATDAYTTDDGGFALLAADQPVTGAGSWIGLAAGSYLVPAGHRLDLPFRLTIPADATPGDHAGGIIAAVTSRQSRADGQQLDLEQRVGARIYVRVEGPVRPAAAVESMNVTRTNPFLPWQPSRTTITYVLRNTGNVRLSGHNTVTVDGPAGWRLATTEAMELPELLPGSTVTVTDEIRGIAPAGRLAVSAHIELTDGEQAVPVAMVRRTVWALPWFLLAMVALAGAAVATIRLRRRLVRRRLSR